MISLPSPGHAPNAVAVIAPAADTVLTYAELAQRVNDVARTFDAYRGSLVFLLVRNDLATVLAMLGLRAARSAVVLLDADVGSEALQAFCDAYHPEAVIASTERAGTPRNVAGVTLWIDAHAGEPATPVHADLALCLATSGCTGSPKLVQLAGAAVDANARGIATALGITPDDRAVTCLPLHYAYGLSLLTSHLVAGASIVVTSANVMDAAFWPLVREHAVTALAGVPFTYELLEKLRLSRVIPPAVGIMTQAGGKLPEDVALRVHAFMAERGGRFHMMYGQTEATARITVMPHDCLPARVGCVGRAIPGGTLEIHDDGGTVLPHGLIGEVVYRGPNVMLGYATTRCDLALGDTMAGTLRTGDLGQLDADGGLRITGRLKRIGKLFGVRIDLDVVENLAARDAPAAVIEGADRLVVFSAGNDSVDLARLGARLAARLRVQQRNIDVRRVTTLPRTASGKIDYSALRAMA